MWKRIVGALVAIVLGAMLTFGAVAFGESLRWTPATTATPVLGQSYTFTPAEMATMTFYVRIDKPNPRDNAANTTGWYYLGETRNGGSSYPADNSLASLMRSYGFSGQTVRFTVSQAFKDTDGVERDSVQSSALAWLVPPVQLEVASMPSFNPAAGNYAAVQNVILSTTTAGASIRYTTDGTTPSATIGTVYSGPIAVGAGTTTIKAVASKAGMTASPVASGTYVVTLPFNPRTSVAPTGLVIR